MNLDYVTIGSIGFAQLGELHYFEKRKIEKEIIREVIAENELFKIPEEFRLICIFFIKCFPYEYDSYDELVIVYDRNVIDEWEDEDVSETYDNDDPNFINEKEPNKFNKFWEFVNKCEEFDWESEDLMEKCQKLYQEKFPMLIVHKRDENEGLKAV